jgi:hypothetical protein
MKRTAIQLDLPGRGMPEIERIDYDLWVLRISVRFEGLREPHYIEFDGPLGFRVLDESDLLAFWSPDDRPDGCVWEIGAGGWLDLERTRPDFGAGRPDSGLREFIVGGINECISVISTSIPTARSPT